jgi:hypothetical protein
MKIIYRRQLPGEGPRVTRIDGWVAALIGVGIAIAIGAVLVLLLPFLLIGFLSFIAIIVFLMIAGWIGLAIRIGWRDMWDFTKAFFTIVFGRGPLENRFERISKAWENRTKGRPGEWIK